MVYFALTLVTGAIYVFKKLSKLKLKQLWSKHPSET